MNENPYKESMLHIAEILLDSKGNGTIRIPRIGVLELEYTSNEYTGEDHIYLGWVNSPGNLVHDTLCEDTSVEHYHPYDNDDTVEYPYASFSAVQETLNNMEIILQAILTQGPDTYSMWNTSE